MKKFAGIAAMFALCTGLAVAAKAPDETKLRTGMKLAGKTHGALGKKIAAKDATAAADAKALGAAFKDSHSFFKKMKATDGVDWSKTATTEYAAISKAVKAGKWDDAAAAHKKASATCMACHGAHREKLADGSYKVK
ncbi:MAG: hypothetical protein JST65_01880 [Acidobacteria bacterium]|nr:hypothetical protein [Acidobacteriota bacterium]